ncbi:hypothetical protein [Actinomadura parmotrematis]|uniref:hypothetical protein n=1 Tax=Actinomadura parmotrematis TaxID=2864039 RepID=UPI00215D7A69|nr:hypothetical protein [Actinomadura parmotrematis]
MHSSDARILRGAAIPSGLAGIAAIAVALLLGGAKGALGAAIGTVVVLVFFSISVVAVSYASRISPQMMFAAAAFSYIAKVLVMLVLVAAFQDVTAWNPAAFAYTVIALTLVWIGAEIRHTVKTKQLYIDEPQRPATPAAEVSADPAAEPERTARTDRDGRTADAAAGTTAEADRST